MRNICLLLAIVLVAGYFGECKGAKPSIYVEIKFAFPWTEMCNLGNYLKENIGKQIVMDDETGGTLPANKIVLYNFDDYCPKGAFEKANVYIFASKDANNKNVGKIDEEMTNKIYTVVNYYYQQKLERYLGSLFVGQIEGVEIAGENAPAKSTDYTEVEKTYIGIGVALIIIVVIIAILVLVVYCKNRNNKDKNSNRYSAPASRAKRRDSSTARTYPESPSAKRNDAYNEGGDNHSKEDDLQTRF